MKVEKEEILHIAKLARLKLKEEELDQYVLSIQDILDFANVVNKADVSGMEVTIGANANCNVFREDKVEQFDDLGSLLQNGQTVEDNMFKLPKVIQ